MLFFFLKSLIIGSAAAALMVLGQVVLVVGIGAWT